MKVDYPKTMPHRYMFPHARHRLVRIPTVLYQRERARSREAGSGHMDFVEVRQLPVMELWELGSSADTRMVRAADCMEGGNM